MENEDYLFFFFKTFREVCLLSYSCARFNLINFILKFENVFGETAIFIYLFIYFIS